MHVGFLKHLQIESDVTNSSVKSVSTPIMYEVLRRFFDVHRRIVIAVKPTGYGVIQTFLFSSLKIISDAPI